MFGLILTPIKETKTTFPYAEKLIEARELIRQGWCKYNHERKYLVGYSDLKIVTHYCVLGALTKVMPTLECNELREIFGRANGIKDIATWNDKIWRTKGSVLRAFNRAIVLAEKEQK